MKNALLLLLIFTFTLCSDYRKPTRAQKKCLVKRLGEEVAKKLLESLRKYHRSNGKATLLDYIIDKRPDLKEVADECLLNIRRRRLDKNNQLNEVDEFVEYYFKSLMKDNKAKSELYKELKKNKSLAIITCETFMQNKEYCKPVVEAMLKTLKI